MTNLNVLYDKFQKQPWNFSFNKGMYIVENFQTSIKNISLNSNYNLHCNASDFIICNNKIQVNQSALLGRNGILPLEIGQDIIKKKILLKIVQILEKKFFLLKYQIAKLYYVSLNANNKQYSISGCIPELYMFNSFFNQSYNASNLKTMLEYLIKQSVKIKEFTNAKFDVISQYQFKLNDTINNKILGSTINVIKSAISITIIFDDFKAYNDFIANNDLKTLVQKMLNHYLKNEISIKYIYQIKLQKTKKYFLKDLSLNYCWIGSSKKIKLKINNFHQPNH